MAALHVCGAKSVQFPTASATVHDLATGSLVSGLYSVCDVMPQV